MFSFLLLIFIAVGSVAFCALTIYRLYSYIDRYRFAESNYTLLFGVLHMRYFVWAYATLCGLTSVICFAFALAFILN